MFRSSSPIVLIPMPVHPAIAMIMALFFAPIPILLVTLSTNTGCQCLSEIISFACFQEAVAADLAYHHERASEVVVVAASSLSHHHRVTISMDVVPGSSSRGYADTPELVATVS